MTSAYTGEMLAKWAERLRADGAGYWYGTCCDPASEELLRQKAKQYPGHYGAGRMGRYREHIAKGITVCDCVGLIKGFFWTAAGMRKRKYGADCPDVNANGMLALCAETGDISALPEKRGVLLWRSGHIGVYVGGGLAIEARGFAYGVVCTKVSGRGWSKWGALPESMMTYSEAEREMPEVRRGDSGEWVREVQQTLKKWSADALPRYGADGKFGAETLDWVKRFQKSAGLAADGIVGKKTWAKLREV